MALSAVVVEQDEVITNLEGEIAQDVFGDRELVALRAIVTNDSRRTPIIGRRFSEEEVDRFRHIHCEEASYSACLDDTIRDHRSKSQTWHCPSSCPGRQTYVDFRVRPRPFNKE